MGACCSIITSNRKSSALLHAVLQKKGLRYPTESIATTELEGLSRIKKIIAVYGDER